MTAVVYLDSSAIAKLLLPEPDREDLRSYLMTRPIRATSTVSLVEVARAIWRRDRQQERGLPEVWASVDLIPFDLGVADRATKIEPPALRTLDAIHVASALQLGTDLVAFVTYDIKLAAAAEERGLRVESPGGRPG